MDVLDAPEVEGPALRRARRLELYAYSKGGRVVCCAQEFVRVGQCFGPVLPSRARHFFLSPLLEPFSSTVRDSLRFPGLFDAFCPK